MTHTWEQYKRKGLSEMRPYVAGDDMQGVSVSEQDALAGSPRDGDMIARNPKNHADQWLVAKQYFEDNLELAHARATLAAREPLAEQCACGEYYPNEGHPDDCPVRQRFDHLTARLAEMTRERDEANEGVEAITEQANVALSRADDAARNAGDLMVKLGSVERERDEALLALDEIDGESTAEIRGLLATLGRDELKKENDALRATLERHEAALTQYANSINWMSHTDQCDVRKVWISSNDGRAYAIAALTRPAPATTTPRASSEAPSNDH